MTITGNYAQPVQVNGFTCRNCTDVDLAKKHIDPAHPQSGPFNIDAANDPTRKNDPVDKFDGAFASAAPGAAVGSATPTYRPGQNLDLRA